MLSPAVDFAALCSRIREGDPAAETELYNFVSTRGIRFYLAGRLRQNAPEFVDDLVHEIFLILLVAVRANRLVKPERLPGYIRTIAKRVMARTIEELMMGRAMIFTLEEMDLPVNDRFCVEREYAVRERHEFMRRAVNALPFNDRDILTRYYFLEHSKEQIEKDLNLTETQFRLRKSRAKMKLQGIGKPKREVRPKLPAVPGEVS